MNCIHLQCITNRFQISVYPHPPENYAPMVDCTGEAIFISPPKPHPPQSRCCQPQRQLALNSPYRQEGGGFWCRSCLVAELPPLHLGERAALADGFFSGLVFWLQLLLLPDPDSAFRAAYHLGVAKSAAIGVGWIFNSNTHYALVFPN